jgi:hypothetical protein
MKSRTLNARTWARVAVLALAAPLLSAAAPRVQDPAPKPEVPKPVETAPVRVPLPGDDAQREMVELFGKVERQLREIDRMLQEASRANASGASELAGMLRDAQASGENVKKGIDRILEIAASQRPPPGSSGSGQGQPQPGQGQGQSPLDRQGEQSTGRESTPSTPDQQGGDQPQPDGKKPGGEKPEPGGEKPDPARGGRENPDGPQGSPLDPEQRPGGPPKSGQAGTGVNPVDDRDRWGDLPTHAREVFRNEGGRDMPPVYREWIDAYYKRLNKKP